MATTVNRLSDDSRIATEATCLRLEQHNTVAEFVICTSGVTHLNHNNECVFNISVLLKGYISDLMDRYTSVAHT